MSGKNYLLDTNVIVDFLNGKIEIAENLKKGEKVLIPNIATAELYYGAEISLHPKKNIKQIKGFLKSFEIVNCNDETSELYAKIKKRLKDKGTPIPDNDIWIASIAKQYNLTLVSRDKHLQQIEIIEVITW